MIKFETNGTNGKNVLNLPTSVKEITPEFLGNVTDEIVIANNYSLIALCHKEKLSAFILAGRGTKNEMSTAVVPIFVKRGYHEPNDFLTTIEVGDKLLISPTAMQLGLHANAPLNNLTMANLVRCIEGDSEAYKNALQYTDEVFFIEFKIVPNNEILGVYKPNLRPKA